MNRVYLLVALAALTTACGANETKRAVFEFELIDGIAVCTQGDPTEVRCAAAQAPDERLPEYVRTPGEVTLAGPESTRLSWMDFGARRDTGARARVTMDSDGGRLLESKYSALRFFARRTSGVVELPVDDDCPCQAGRFELTFQDSGEDGVLGTSDDQHRRLTRGRIRTDGRPFCAQRVVLPIVDGELTVRQVACPVSRSNSNGSAGGNLTSTGNSTSQTTSGFWGFESHEECVFFGWEDEETYNWNGGLEDWDAEEAESNGWYDEDWNDSPDAGDDWADNWDESADWSDSTDGGWGGSSGSGSSSGGDYGGSSDWGDDGSGDDGSWDDWGDDDDSWDDGGWGDDGSWDDWGDDSGDDDYWDDDDGWGDE